MVYHSLLLYTIVCLEQAASRPPPPPGGRWEPAMGIVAPFGARARQESFRPGRNPDLVSAARADPELAAFLCLHVLHLGFGCFCPGESIKLSAVRLSLGQGPVGGSVPRFPPQTMRNGEGHSSPSGRGGQPRCRCMFKVLGFYGLTK